MPDALSILSMPETTNGNRFMTKSNTSSGKIPFRCASLTFINGSNEQSRKLDESNII